MGETENAKIEENELDKKIREETEWLRGWPERIAEREQKNEGKKRLERERIYLGESINIPKYRNFIEHKEKYPEIYLYGKRNSFGKFDFENAIATRMHISPLIKKSCTDDILKQFVDIKKHNKKFSTTTTKRRAVGGRSGRERTITTKSNFLEDRYEGELYLKEVLSIDNTQGKINEFEALKIIFERAIRQDSKGEHDYCRYDGKQLAIKTIENITKELQKDIIDMSIILKRNQNKRVNWPDLGELKGMISNPHYAYLNRLADYMKQNKGKPIKDITDAFFKEQELYNTIYDSNSGLLKEIIHYAIQRNNTLQRQLNQKYSVEREEKLKAYKIIEQRYKKMLSNIELIKDVNVYVNNINLFDIHQKIKYYTSSSSIAKVVFERNKYFLDDLLDDTGACLGLEGSQRRGSLCYLLDKSMYITHINEYSSSNHVLKKEFKSILKNISFIGINNKKEKMLILDGSILSDEYEHLQETYFSLNYKGLIRLAKKIRADKILINTSHSRAQQSTHDFVKYIADQNGLKEGTDYVMEKNGETVVFKLLSGLKTTKEGFQYTHKVNKKPIDKSIVEAVSNGDYKGEQFLDSLYLWEKYHNPSNPKPQWNMGKGYITAIEILVKK
ncbi:MAG: hypothetical protein ACP5OA_04245 [Candidatus Woesearchaeota archaeon]